MIAVAAITAVLVGALAGTLYYQVASLQNRNKELQDQISSLESRFSTLEALNAQLQAWLKGNKTLLEKAQQWLIGNKTYYEKVIAELQRQVTDLQKQVSELGSIVNLEKTATLEKDRTVNLPPNSYVRFSYSTPYAGYVTIAFTATGRVELRIGSDSANPEWYFYYTSTGAYTVVKVPVTRGTTYIYFSNPSIIFGITVTFTLTYTY